MEATRDLANNQQQFIEASAERRALTQSLSRSSSKIEILEQLAHALLEEIATLKEPRRLKLRDDVRTVNLHDQVRRFEAKLMLYALRRTGGHQARAAQLLGIKATTFHYKMKRYQLSADAPDEDGSSVEASRWDGG